MSIFSALLKLFQGTVERPSPGDWLPKDAISVDDNELIIDFNYLKVKTSQPVQIWIPPVPDTNSMDGVFDIGNNNILIAGINQDDHQLLVDALRVGDIAVYRYGTTYAIHRIVEIYYDGEGKYFVFKGDNNPARDRHKVRQSMIEWISIGVIY